MKTWKTRKVDGAYNSAQTIQPNPQPPGLVATSLAPIMIELRAMTGLDKHRIETDLLWKTSNHYDASASAPVSFIAHEIPTTP